MVLSGNLVLFVSKSNYFREFVTSCYKHRCIMCANTKFTPNDLSLILLKTPIRPFQKIYNLKTTLHVISMLDVYIYICNEVYCDLVTL